MGWFTITKVNMSTGKEIEIIFNGLKEKVPGDTTILGSFNRQKRVATKVSLPNTTTGLSIHKNSRRTRGH